MAVSVLIPSVLKRYTNNLSTIEVAGSNIHELVQELRTRYPELGGHLLDEEGNLRKFVNLYLGDENIRDLAGGETPLKDGDVISIVPAVAGGMATVSLASLFPAP